MLIIGYRQPSQSTSLPRFNKESADATKRRRWCTTAHVTENAQALQISLLYEDDSIRQKIQEVFPKLGIVACSGHLIDSPGKRRRFPQEAEEIVRSKIDQRLNEIDATCGYSSAGCGTDIIFLEAMAERGGETHIFLPFEKDKFIETSVLREGSNWVDRFEKALIVHLRSLCDK